MPVHAFGPFVLELADRRLMRDGRPVVLPGKAWQILVLLVEAGGRLVTREAFRAKLWPNVVVEDRTLVVHMSTLRKALGSSPSADYIETISGAGYRLTVPVRLLTEADPALRAGSQAPPSKAMPIAVRAFSTSSVAEADVYLGVGIADAVTTPLGAVEDLADARTLGLSLLLEGTVRRSAERLHVSARLIDVASGGTQWSERFEHPVADGIALQDAIAERVATSLAGSPVVDQARVHSYRPQSSEAYLLQLRARANLKLYTRLPAVKALGLFEQALALDPDFATAHAGLASTYLALASSVILRPLPIDEAMPLARHSAERALALDEGLAEAWAALGRVKMEYDWDWDGAEADLAHAVALNPNSVEALAAYGQFLGAMGRHDEAFPIMEQARRLDPRRLETLWHLGFVCWMAEQNDRALDAFGAALTVPPRATRGHMGRMLVLDHLGRHDEAMVERLAWLKRQVPPQTAFAEHLAELDRSGNWRVAMAEWLAMLERINFWVIVAMQCMVVDERTRALDALERWLSDRKTYLAFVPRLPSFRTLQDEPRFRQILRTMKFDGR
jgi:DNA-binding winged helix-turn-helix (wHTH) protein/tetratricopeptide (TPR) repeat protein